MWPYLARRSDLSSEELNCVLMVAFHNGHKLNRKATDLAQTPRLPTTHHQHHQLPATTTATTMGEQRQQHKRQVG